MSIKPVILWIRRDLRLSDHMALQAAIETGQPIIPLFIRDGLFEALGAAPKWRFGLGLEAFDQALQERGSKLLLRSGDALEAILALIAETGADKVFWSRLYDPSSIVRDTHVKSKLKEIGVEVQSFAGHLLFEPFDVATKGGTPFKVYTPFWRAVRQLTPKGNMAFSGALNAPTAWPQTEHLQDWALGHVMQRGAEIVARYVKLGEAQALKTLETLENDPAWFLRYKEGRDFLDRDVCSGLSEHLTYGEIAPLRLWHIAERALRAGVQGAEKFLQELVWRDFAHYLLYHFPSLERENWRAEWNKFPWRQENEDASKWRQGMTGEPVIDAAMRELYVTGRMHNRARMLVASYLTKHLLTDWRIGLDWFAETLTDWDPASNAMGWQWVAGSGPDAAPYFRIFNPETQAEKFDQKGVYRRRFLDPNHSEEARLYFRAIPKAWGISETTAPPLKCIVLQEGRLRALDAYSALKSIQ